jgi:hypothetical protein
MDEKLHPMKSKKQLQSIHLRETGRRSAKGLNLATKINFIYVCLN